VGQNVIELNGKRYDAITGAYLGKSHVVPQHITERYARGKVIDGFVRPSHPVARKPKPAQAPKPQAAAMPAKPQPSEAKAAKQAHGKPHHLKAHNPERAKTLMRRAIKKPEFSLKPAIKIQPPAEIMTKPVSAIAHKRSAYGVDPSRRKRAELTGKHYAIKHFNPAHRPATADPVTPRLSVIPVRRAPTQTAVRAAHPGKNSDIFEKAIARASSHQQPAHKVRSRRKHRRVLNSLAIVAAFLVIGGFVTYLNLPQLQLRVASVRAGFGASMPSHVPTGYALEDGVERSGGTITLSFRSGDSRFRITQQSSNWNSQTLLDNTLALGGSHQTVQKNGQTIYVYDNNTGAAWVNAGVRYDLNGNAQLSTDDIISIATSL
jgi:hypothetical protein